MKTKLLTISVVIMLIFIAVGSCDEFDIESCAGANYIYVVVDTSVNLTITDFTHSTPWEDALVEVRIVKDDGENVTEQRITDNEGNIEPVNATFKVYKEQPVEVWIKVLHGPMPEFMGVESWDPWKYSVVPNFKKLFWNQIEGVGYKNTYYWYPRFDATVQPNPN